VAAEAGKTRVTYKEALFGENYKRATWTCFFVAFFNQACAIDAVNIFCTTLLIEIERKTNGEFPLKVKDGAFFIGVANTFFATFATIPIRYIGRKKILFGGHFLMGTAQVLIGVMYMIDQYVALYCFLILFISGFQLSTGNLSFIYFAEACVDSAMGVVIACQFFTMVVFSLAISYMVDSALKMQGTFWIYAVINFIGVVFVGVFVKETKGKTPAELKALYLPKGKVAKEDEQVELANSKPSDEVAAEVKPEAAAATQ